jgi:uncharacterized protein (DUF952 family)
MTARRLYHICDRQAWTAAHTAGAIRPAEGETFVHLSAAHQVAATLARHFAGRTDLVLLAIDPAKLPCDPTWTQVPARGEALPHLEADLPTAAVVAVHDLPLDAAGRHVLPAPDTEA